MFTKSINKKKISGMILSVIISMTCVFFAGGTSYGSGWISVVPGSGGSHEYRAYLLIGGRVADDGVISEVYFGEGITPDFWETLDVPFSPATATWCAEWISENTEQDNTGRFVVALALAALKHGLPCKAEFSSNDTVKLEDGYYLIISDETQPVMVLAGNDNVIKINEKSFAPEISKGVREVSDTAYGDQADTGFGEAVSYCVACSLPSNYNAYPGYRFAIHDSNEPGIVPDISSAKLMITGSDGKVKKDITDIVEIIPENNGLLMEIPDLKAVYENAEGDEKILLEYDAFLDKDRATTGADTNDNYCCLTYQSSPVSDRMKTTAKVKASVYTWVIELTKTDLVTGSVLGGAKFTIKDEYGRYLNTDGTLSRKETADSVWSTDSKGMITIRCIDSGTYTVTETEPPEGYVRELPFVISVEADTEGREAILKASVNGRNAKISSVDARTGKISVDLREAQIPEIPQGIPGTGDDSNVTLYIGISAGTLVIVFTLMLLLKQLTGKKKYI